MRCACVLTRRGLRAAAESDVAVSRPRFPWLNLGPLAPMEFSSRDEESGARPKLELPLVPPPPVEALSRAAIDCRSPKAEVYA